jgi:hypothetical protein
MITLTDIQATKLQALLIDYVTKFVALQRELKLTDLSVHIAPDSSWISVEHDLNLDRDILERKSPACHQILLKL